MKSTGTYNPLRALMRTRMLSGELPRLGEHHIFAGKGEAVSCGGCDALIAPSQVQYDVELIDANGGTLVLPMHLPCFDAWQQESGAALERSLDAAVAIMRSQFASIQIFDGDGSLELRAWRGFHPESAKSWRLINFDSITSCAAAMRLRQRFCVQDVEDWQEIRCTRDYEEFRRSGIRAMQSTPLFSSAGELKGVMSTHWSRPHLPSEDELREFDVLAREVGGSLANED